MNAPLPTPVLQVVAADAVPSAANTPNFGEMADGASPVAQRLAHLFRASLKHGRIHPLYLPMLRYRHTQQVD